MRMQPESNSQAVYFFLAAFIVAAALFRAGVSPIPIIVGIVLAAVIGNRMRSHKRRRA
jgi:hypothetical protein